MTKRGLLFTLGVFILFSTCPSLAFDRRVTTSGQCISEVSPDRGSVSFSVERTEKNVKDAIQKATSAYEKLVAALKKTKAKDLELSTNEYSVYEKKEWENNKQVSRGFAARLGVRATTSEIGNITDLIAAAADLGVTETQGLSTFLSEAKSLIEKKKCLDIAAKNAREKAETLARSLDARIGKVLAMSEEGSSSPEPVFGHEMMADAAPMAKRMTGPTIETQKQTIQLSVSATFSLE